MSLWLQEEMKKTEERRKKTTPGSKSIIVAVIVLAVIEAALFIANSYTPDYNTLPLCGIVGIMGLLIIVIFASKSKTTPNKPILPFAAKCIQELRFSPEELQQFDTEMTASPLVLNQDKNRSDLPLLMTAHYMASAFLYSGEIDYGIYRLSDIAMTCYASGNGIFDIDLLNTRCEKIGGITLNGKNNFTEFNTALERYAPHIQLNVPMKEVKKMRRNS